MTRKSSDSLWQKFKSSKLNELREHEESGKADSKIMQLVHKINSAPDFVTTSSCAGRINLVGYDLNEGKKTADFYKKWHRVMSSEEVELALSEYTAKKCCGLRLSRSYCTLQRKTWTRQCVS